MNNFTKWAMLLVVLPVVFVCTLLAMDEPPSQPVRIQVLNPDGTPAEGVLVGQIFFNTGKGQSEKPPKLVFIGEHSNNPENSRDAILSNEKGEVNVTRAHLFYADDLRTRVVLAVTENQNLMGLMSLSPTDNISTVTIQLRKTKPVEITPKSTGLAELGTQLDGSVLYFSYAGFPIYELVTAAKSHSVRLPPGEYTARTYNHQTYRTQFDVVIEPDTKSIQKTIDLLPTVLEKLTGKVAPEFRQIKDWYGSESLTLESLRGKVVILDFWGHWCGPCVYRMPKLFALYEKHRENGLVIIGIHDDSVKDAGELNRELISIRKELWEGRDVPFPIAIDGGGEFPIEGFDATVKGATTAAYGVANWPTYIIIDREGKLRGRFNPNSEDHKQLLLELLGIEAE